MKHTLPLVAALAATLATPVLAQDVSGMLNPRAMIAEMGLGDIMHGSASHRLAAPRVIALPQNAEIAALDLDTTVLSSPRPLLRPSTLAAPSLARLEAPSVIAADAADLLDTMQAASDATPAGANTVVIAGADTAIVSGTNTAVIQSSGPAPRLTLWQRIFGH